MTPEQMHGVADLLRSLWPILIFVLAWMFRHSIEKRIERVAKVRGLGWELEFQEAVTRAEEALTTQPPADANPQIEAEKASPMLAKALISVDRKPLPIEELVWKVADAYRLPHTPTVWLAAADVLKLAATTVTTTGSVTMKDDQLTITLRPEIKPVLEAKAKEVQVVLN